MKQSFYDNMWKKLETSEKILAASWWTSIIVLFIMLWITSNAIIIAPLILICFSLQIITVSKISQREKSQK